VEEAFGRDRENPGDDDDDDDEDDEDDSGFKSGLDGDMVMAASTSCERLSWALFGGQLVRTSITENMREGEYQSIRESMRESMRERV